MIDNFAIGFFTLCIVYTAFRACKLDRASKQENTLADQNSNSQQTAVDDVLRNKQD